MKKHTFVLHWKYLTFSRKHGIIIKLSDESGAQESPEAHENWEKKRESRGRAVELKAGCFSNRKSEKSFEKTLKKGLTNFTECGIIRKSPDGDGK